jgi:hypothetical protein
MKMLGSILLISFVNARLYEAVKCSISAMN